MSGSLNEVNLIGNFTRDVEIKTIGNGNTVCNFGLATSESFKNEQGTWIERPEFHNLVAWGKTADLIGRMARKGTQAHVKGKLKTTKYEKKTGEVAYKTEILVDRVIFLNRFGSQGDVPAAEPAAAPGYDFAGDDELL